MDINTNEKLKRHQVIIKHLMASDKHENYSRVKKAYDEWRSKTETAGKLLPSIWKFNCGFESYDFDNALETVKYCGVRNYNFTLPLNADLLREIAESRNVYFFLLLIWHCSDWQTYDMTEESRYQVLGLSGDKKFMSFVLRLYRDDSHYTTPIVKRWCGKNIFIEASEEGFDKYLTFLPFTTLKNFLDWIEELDVSLAVKNSLCSIFLAMVYFLRRSYRNQNKVSMERIASIVYLKDVQIISKHINTLIVAGWFTVTNKHWCFGTEDNCGKEYGFGERLEDLNKKTKEEEEAF